MPVKASMLIGLVIGLSFNPAWAVTIETVPVGNPGNVGEWSGQSYGGFGPDRICGSVGYTYNIGKYEVTAGQYTEFLNNKGGVDTYGLYNTNMWSSINGCKIQRSGTSGSYTYSVASDYANRPVNYVGFWDSCRFANWLSNGQGNGDTENGTYTLTTDGIANNTVARNANWKWAVTSEDEWYKAAYHKNDGLTGNYWDYPTSSDTAPGQDMADASGNNANYYTAPYVSPIDSGKFTTVAGEFQNSDSPYGTFDQAGNVVEWNESVSGSQRGMRGGAFATYYDGYLQARFGFHWFPTYEDNVTGFRVASEVPEPATVMMLALAGITLLRRR